MRVFFALVGLVFDLVMLAVSAAAVYCVFRPETFGDAAQFALDWFDEPDSRWIVLGAAAGLLLLSLRGVLLLLFGRGESGFEVSGGQGGAVTVSRGTVDRAIDSLVRETAPGARVTGRRIKRRGGKIEVALRVRLDGSDTPLGELTTRLRTSVEGCFRDFLGVEISRLDIAIEGAAVKEKGAAS